MPEAAPPELEVALGGNAERRGPFGATLHYFSEIGSTNDEAARLAEAGAAEGTTVVASAQTAGRGRLGRSWFSPAGAGLYVSVIVRERRAAPLLTLAGGVAVAEGIRAATGLPVEIKWPNDIVVDAGRGHRRKLAGILAEASTGPEGLQYVILGFGINLLPTAYPLDLADSATSLAAELGRSVDAGLVLAECLGGIGDGVRDLASGNRQTVLDRWARLAPSATGSRVECEGARGVISGVTAGVAPDGSLLVRAGSHVEPIRSGQVRWL
ncbi:MAG TPA: biotin--[acetyl-CoA-carboxylase] ligase [Vicinamibacterales bacterium]|nr:biotin--[acetyl-CoA-carboxylase] ligase [Vicinamibacterales bacterium]